MNSAAGRVSRVARMEWGLSLVNRATSGRVGSASFRVRFVLEHLDQGAEATSHCAHFDRDRLLVCCAGIDANLEMPQV